MEKPKNEEIHLISENKEFITCIRSQETLLVLIKQK